MTLVKDDKQNEDVDILNKDNTNDTEDNLEDCSLPCFKLKLFNSFKSPTWFLGYIFEGKRHDYKNQSA